MVERIRFLINRLREQLWIRPLLMCMVSVAAVFLARTGDYLDVGKIVPEVSLDTTETLLKILGSSMLVIATFAVGSMVSSYASASNTATPRSFPLVISDDVSQNALSGFIGAFIFSIVALVALKSGFYDKTGHFILFCATLFVFAVVILVFLRWVDCIARLGRLGTTIDKVEEATAAALKIRKHTVMLGGLSAGHGSGEQETIHTTRIGYVQRVDIEKLQLLAEDSGLYIDVVAMPGTFTEPGQALARFSTDGTDPAEVDGDCLVDAFEIGDSRTFDEDPRFGLIVLAEIAGRALSPAVNDPGTAIDIIATFVRLFELWSRPVPEDKKQLCKYDRVRLPESSISDMFDDAFTGIARDGAGTVEVAVRLQKALRVLADMGDPALSAAAAHHSRLALARAESALDLPEDLSAVKAAAAL